jgi:hypothetical protein
VEATAMNTQVAPGVDVTAVTTEKEVAVEVPLVV